MKQWTIALLFAGAFFIQTTLINLISIAGVTPNLLICLTILLTLLNKEPVWTIGIAAVTAMLYDICFAEYIGISSAAILVVGCSVYLTSNRLNIGNLVPILVLTAIETFLYHFIVWGGSKLVGGVYLLSHVMGSAVFYSVYNVVVVALLYFIIIKAGEEDE